jgi:hypothetical protein
MTPKLMRATQALAYLKLAIDRTSLLPTELNLSTTFSVMAL